MAPRCGGLEAESRRLDKHSKVCAWLTRSAPPRASGAPCDRARHRRPQRPALGDPRPGPLRPDRPRHRDRSDRDRPAHRHPAAAGRRRRCPVLVGLRAEQLAGEAAVTATLEQIDFVYQLVARYPKTSCSPDRRRGGGRTLRGPHRIADRHRGRAFDRLLARHAAHDARARRPLPDADPHRATRRGPTAPPTSPRWAGCRRSATRWYGNATGSA